jgi:hypothetical protein
MNFLSRQRAQAHSRITASTSDDREQSTDSEIYVSIFLIRSHESRVMLITLRVEKRRPGWFWVDGRSGNESFQRIPHGRVERNMTTRDHSLTPGSVPW